jgi:hypothetical protein
MHNRWFLTCFFLFVLFLSSFYLDVWRNANTTSRALPIVTWYESGTFQIDKYHELTVDKAFVNGHYYTDKAPLPTYLVLPFFGLLKATGIVQPDGSGDLFGDPVYMLGGFLTASLPFALFLLYLLKKVQEYKPEGSAILLVSLPFFGSFIYVFTGTYFAHLLSAALLLWGMIYLEKNKIFLGGFLSGLAFLSEYNLGLIVLIWGMLLLLRDRSVRKFLLFSVGVAPSLLFQLAYNAYFSTSPFTFLYKYHNFSELDTHYGFVIPDWEPLWGLTFSPYRGIFFFVPILLIGFLILYQKLKKQGWKGMLSGYVSLPFLTYFVFIASYFAWWGGWTYGPRLLLAITFIWAYKVVLWVVKQKKYTILLGILSVFGLFLILPAKGTIAYSAPTGVWNPFLDLVVKNLLNGEFNPNNLMTFLFDVAPKTAFFVFLCFFTTGFLVFSLWNKRFSQ